jgi:two-component system, chemotaxis family, chemotaxis protein CheY
MQLLIAIDDSKVALIQVQKYVQKNFPNCEVLSTTNPIEGIELIRKHKDRLDFVIIDYNMKEMNGLEAVAQFQNSVDLAKVVICSANTQKVLMERAAGQGLRFIEKPLTQEKIDNLILPLKNKAS